MTYRYDHFRPAVVLDELRALGKAIPPGTELPRFTLPTTDGGRFDSSEHLGQQPMLLVLASYT